MVSFLASGMTEECNIVRFVTNNAESEVDRLCGENSFNVHQVRNIYVWRQLQSTVHKQWRGNPPTRVWHSRKEISFQAFVEYKKKKDLFLEENDVERKSMLCIMDNPCLAAVFARWRL